MPCALIGAYTNPCRDAVGGVFEIKVKIHPGTTAIAADFTVSSGVVTIANTSSRTLWYTYYIHEETAVLSSDPQTNTQNGTLFYMQKLAFVFNKLTSTLNNELHVLAQNRLLFAVRDRNTNYWLMGLDFGANMTPSTSGTGTASGDRSGYNLTFEAKEVQQLMNLSAATYNTLVT